MATIRHGSDSAGIEINGVDRLDFYLEPPPQLPPTSRLAIRRSGTSEKKNANDFLLILNHF
jgi:hypothetical protein